jgi:hypothetical protein
MQQVAALLNHLVGAGEQPPSLLVAIGRNRPADANSLDTFVPLPASGAWIAKAPAVGEKLEMLRNISCRLLLNH